MRMGARREAAAAGLTAAHVDPAVLAELPPELAAEIAAALPRSHADVHAAMRAAGRPGSGARAARLRSVRRGAPGGAGVLGPAGGPPRAVEATEDARAVWAALAAALDELLGRGPGGPAEAAAHRSGSGTRSPAGSGAPRASGAAGEGSAGRAGGGAAGWDQAADGAAKVDKLACADGAEPCSSGSWAAGTTAGAAEVGAARGGALERRADVPASAQRAPAGDEQGLEHGLAQANRADGAAQGSLDALEWDEHSQTDQARRHQAGAAAHEARSPAGERGSSEPDATERALDALAAEAAKFGEALVPGDLEGAQLLLRRLAAARARWPRFGGRAAAAAARVQAAAVAALGAPLALRGALD
jgi:hypothetical protein